MKPFSISGLACATSLFVALTIPAQVKGQDYFDVLKLNYSYSPNNSFEGGTGSIRIDELTVDATAPFVVNNKTTILTGFIYDVVRASFYDGANPIALTSVALRMGVSVKHSDKWTGTYILLPKIASDFKEISSEDFQLGGIVLFKYLARESINYKIGLYANYELFGPWFVPLLGFYYKPEGSKLEVNVNAPVLVDVNYRLPGVTLGVSFNGMIRSYHLNYTAVGNKERYLMRATTDIGAYAGIRLSESLIVQGRLGRSIGRYYRVYADDDRIDVGFPLTYIGDNREQLNTDLSDGWLFQASVIYRVNTK